jgi:hypothetical protein
MSIPVWGGTMLPFLLLLVLFAIFRRRWLAIRGADPGIYGELRRQPRGLAACQRAGRSLRSVDRRHRVFAAFQTAIILVAVRFGLLTILVAWLVSVLLTLMPICHQLVGPVRVIVSTHRGNRDCAGCIRLAHRRSPVARCSACFSRRNQPGASDQGNLKVSSSSNRLSRRYRRNQEAVMNHDTQTKSLVFDAIAMATMFAVATLLAALVYLVITLAVPFFESRILPVVSAQGAAKTLVAVFAHGDDETVAAPVLARYAREAAHVHLIIATDGAQGGAHTPIPRGAELAGIRAEEVRCAASALGIQPPILVGFPDAQLGSYMEDPSRLFQLTARLQGELQRLHADALITWGPDGGTGHPDHRLVSSVVTQLVRAGAPGRQSVCSTPRFRSRGFVR